MVTRLTPENHTVNFAILRDQLYALTAQLDAMTKLAASQGAQRAMVEQGMMTDEEEVGGGVDEMRLQSPNEGRDVSTGVVPAASDDLEGTRNPRNREDEEGARNALAKSIETIEKFQSIQPGEKDVDISGFYQELAGLCGNLGDSSQAKEAMEKAIALMEKMQTKML